MYPRVEILYTAFSGLALPGEISYRARPIFDSFFLIFFVFFPFLFIFVFLFLFYFNLHFIF
jgi:hypothetical protein